MARKNLGQNFMTNKAELEFIANSVPAKKKDLVLEIGPGLGALTEKLLARELSVLAIEKDEKLKNFLVENFSGQPLTLLLKDVLKVDPANDCVLSEPIWVAGNIPYNVTSPILFWLVKNRKYFCGAVLTIQCEVAHRLCGKPGNKEWGALSVSMQTYAKVKFLKKISRGNFFPVPKVDSAVILIKFYDKPLFPVGEDDLFHLLVAKAFQKRRKTLLNALDEFVPSATKELLLKSIGVAGLMPGCRPETLSVANWCDLTSSLSSALKR